MSLIFALKGRQGDKGDEGDKGDKGDKGDQGDKGDIGDLSFVDRGDPASWDFTVGDFTADGNYNDLDLSGIIPENTKAVIVTVIIEATAANLGVHFRTKGNTNLVNMQSVVSQVANQHNKLQFVIKPDANRKIEYSAAVTTWTALQLVVMGWYV